MEEGFKRQVKKLFTNRKKKMSKEQKSILVLAIISAFLTMAMITMMALLMWDLT